MGLSKKGYNSSNYTFKLLITPIIVLINLLTKSHDSPSKACPEDFTGSRRSGSKAIEESSNQKAGTFPLQEGTCTWKVGGLSTWVLSRLLSTLKGVLIGERYS